MAVDVGGLVSIIVFYILILVIGLWAARKTGFKTKNLKIDDVMLANRSLNLVLGFFTITATWVSGALINGVTEIVARDGLLWCQGPIGYGISSVFAGLFFAEKMRMSGFTTMLDPFHWKFGKVMNCLLYFPALTGDIFWSGAILAALGATLKVVLDINLELAIILSAVISVIYTLLGGLYSVAYTDVIQLILTFIGMWLCVPFVLTHDATKSIAADGSSAWLGSFDTRFIASYIDVFLLLMFGGIPWQEYWQRALSSKTVRVAQCLAHLSAIGCAIMAIPSVLMGAAAASTNWTMTGYGKPEIDEEDTALTLPLVIKHLCPTVVGFIGLGALSAAVMSSMDSAILAASTMFARNVYGVIYGSLIKTKPSETMLVWVMRASQVVIAIFSCVMAIKVTSVYTLFLLCSDFIYVLLFPQLVCVLYMKKSNSYGSFVAFFTGLILRLLGGEKGLNLAPVIEYPWYDGKTQLFPFRTFSMLASLFSLIIVSLITDFLFRNEIISLRYDFYGCFQHFIKGHTESTKQLDMDSSSNDVYLSSSSKEIHVPMGPHSKEADMSVNPRRREVDRSHINPRRAEVDARMCSGDADIDIHPEREEDYKTMNPRGMIGPCKMEVDTSKFSKEVEKPLSKEVVLNTSPHSKDEEASPYSKEMGSDDKTKRNPRSGRARTGPVINGFRTTDLSGNARKSCETQV